MYKFSIYIYIIVYYSCDPYQNKYTSMCVYMALCVNFRLQMLHIREINIVVNCGRFEPNPNQL